MGKSPNFPHFHPTHPDFSIFIPAEGDALSIDVNIDQGNIGHGLDSTTDVILGLDPEGHQPRVVPMGFGHGVGAGSLEVEVKAIEGAEVWVTPCPARGDQGRDAVGLGTAGPTALLGAAAQGLAGVWEGKGSRMSHGLGEIRDKDWEKPWVGEKDGKKVGGSHEIEKTMRWERPSNGKNHGMGENMGEVMEGTMGWKTMERPWEKHGKNNEKNHGKDHGRSHGMEETMGETVGKIMGWGKQHAGNLGRNHGKNCPIPDP